MFTMIQFNYWVVWIWHILESMRQNVSVPPCVNVVSLCVKAGSCLCGSLMFVSLHGKLRLVSVVLTPPPPDSWAFWERKPASLWREGGRERERERERKRGGGRRKDKPRLSVFSTVHHNDHNIFNGRFCLQSASKTDSTANPFPLYCLLFLRWTDKELQLRRAYLTRH